MKKKLKFGVIVLSLAALLCSCDKTKLTDVTPSETATNVSQGATTESTNTSSVFTALSNFPFANSIYYADANGNYISDYDDFEIDGSICYLDGKNIYYSVYNYDERTDKSSYDFYVKNADTNTIRKIDTLSNYSFFDIYEDTLYIFYKDYSNNTSIEYAYDTKDYKPVATNEKFWSNIATYEFLYCYETPLCAKRALDENGFVLLEKNNSYYKYDGVKVEKINFDADFIQLCAFTKHGIIYLDSFEDTYENYNIYLYDISTGNTTLLAECISDYLFGDNTAIYWLNEDEHEYCQEKYSVVGYKFENAKSETLFQISKNPGTQNLLGIDSKFIVADHYIYYLCNNAKEIVWFRYDLNQKNPPVEIGPAIMTFDYFQYGTVEAFGNTEKCVKCGTTLSETYYEYFVLNDSVSKEAKKINQYLYDQVHDNELVGPEPDEEDCEMHYPETDYSYIDSVEIINEKYLSVTTDGYWYGGGAHGYPSIVHTLFDLETGEVVTLLDFYNGTELELKELIATKTKEDCESYESDYGPYYSDSDAAYRDAYDAVSFDYIPGYIVEGGFVVSYAPYMLGPYASGYIEFFIPFEDFGIELSSVKAVG